MFYEYNVHDLAEIEEWEVPLQSRAGGSNPSYKNHTRNLPRLSATR